MINESGIIENLLTFLTFGKIICLRIYKFLPRKILLLHDRKSPGKHP